MVLIGLMGIKGSGKTTGAAYLVDHYYFVEKSFAECLKKACKELFLLSDEQVFGTQEQKETPDPRWFGCTPRKMLQFVGTELLRDNLDKIMPGLGKNVFTHHFKLWYESEIKMNPNLCVVVSDVRFQNEIDFIQSLGGVVIKIDRPCVQTNDMHQSEIELQSISTYNHLINNTGTIDDLYRHIDEYLNCTFSLEPTIKYTTPEQYAYVMENASYFANKNMLSRPEIQMTEKQYFERKDWLSDS
ncbi:hypothetical protein QJ857_gp1056 [Tupanvirus soda lake]|uniref:Deoxynucleotide monophosphate kinase n=2 Tax=Tupanvirus TaxID=2094720 RepID=A0A6N1NTU6_9VIRU|nr:hypothetical protein QJ857_gp1056 [Tupanvirus soda lake]QKU34998.1 hypothetical protein [Tupanvirus soda lake]